MWYMYKDHSRYPTEIPLDFLSFILIFKTAKDIENPLHVTDFAPLQVFAEWCQHVPTWRVNFEV